MRPLEPVCPQSFIPHSAPHAPAPSGCAGPRLDAVSGRDDPRSVHGERSGFGLVRSVPARRTQGPERFAAVGPLLRIRQLWRDRLQALTRCRKAAGPEGLAPASESATKSDQSGGTQGDRRTIGLPCRGSDALEKSGFPPGMKYSRNARTEEYAWLRASEGGPVRSQANRTTRSAYGRGSRTPSLDGVPPSIGRRSGQREKRRVTC